MRATENRSENSVSGERIAQRFSAAKIWIVFPLRERLVQWAARRSQYSLSSWVTDLSACLQLSFLAEFICIGIGHGDRDNAQK